ncbi:HAD family phosphatase [Corynebacterium breve]|uniref:HAD family phosphatase n=1 Tax=Corynebacterium breve TaxID=3049799 RepID=A0ABY8VGS9_9CORY|nr:HAD family phosphatase [Corynebacterium breve]WIM68850.1 HAD family phosphatase [Corynebacterium breve]
MPLPAAIFWDMDGTLIDTEPLWEIATYELSEAVGRRLSLEKRLETMGGSFANTLQICADWAGVTYDDADATRWKDGMYARMRELLSGDIDTNPGIKQLLISLRETGIPMFVTTNTERTLADPCIDSIGREFFHDTITGDEVPAGKPAPDMYVEAARRVGEDPKRCLVFEDSWAGMSAGSAAGCKVLGLADEVPAGVVRFDPKRFVGANASDVATWFEAMS